MHSSSVQLADTTLSLHRGLWVAERSGTEYLSPMQRRPSVVRIGIRDVMLTYIFSTEKIYIAAAFYNNAAVLPYWSQSMLSVIRYLGPENVFVSVVESYSQDKTPDLLRQLDLSLAKLHVPHRILIQDIATEKPEDLSFDNRIEFLAAVRNRAMEPLVERGGYDKVLFSNDVFVEPESIIELIETADGNYDFACAMDFNHFGCVLSTLVLHDETDPAVARTMHGCCATGLDTSQVRCTYSG